MPVVEALSSRPRVRIAHPESALMKRTRALLAETDIRYYAIFEATGIQASWLTEFKKGNIPDPSVNRVETLYNFLRGTPLEVE